MQTTSTKRFAIFFVLGFAVMWSGVVTLHVLGNPDGIFPSPAIPNRSNRAWKVRRLQGMCDEGSPPQTVILGSSRMMQMSPMLVEAITGQRAFNFAAVGSSPFESLAQLRYLLRAGAKPQTLVVGVDESAMFGLYRQWEGQIVEDWEILREVPVTKRIAVTGRAISQIRFDRTGQAIRELCGTRHLEPRDPKTVGNFLLADGYRVRAADSWRRFQHPWDAQARLASLAKYAANLAKDRARNFANARVQAEQRRNLNELLELARTSGIKVKLVMTPMQPAYAKLVINAQARKEIDQFAARLKKRCRQDGFDFFDFRDLKDFDGLPQEFWDEQHPTPVNAARMINRIFGLAPRTEHPNVPHDAALILNPPGVNSLTTW